MAHCLTLYVLDRTTNFKHITSQDLKIFYEDFLKGQRISYEEYVHLSALVQDRENEEQGNDFRVVRYRPFSEYRVKVYVLENRPRIACNVVVEAVDNVPLKNFENFEAKVESLQATLELMTEKMAILQERVSEERGFTD
ncbi:hypothetical protein NGRA_3542, partial [Nosema granulosis]